MKSPENTASVQQPSPAEAALPPSPRAAADRFARVPPMRRLGMAVLVAAGLGACHARPPTKGAPASQRTPSSGLPTAPAELAGKGYDDASARQKLAIASPAETLGHVAAQPRPDKDPLGGQQRAFIMADDDDKGPGPDDAVKPTAPSAR
jgi:hypothetical protein